MLLKSLEGSRLPAAEVRTGGATSIRAPKPGELGWLLAQTVAEDARLGLGARHYAGRATALASYWEQPTFDGPASSWFAIRLGRAAGGCVMIMATDPLRPDASDPGAVAWVELLYVHPSFRKLGIADRLLTTLLDRAREMTALSVVARVHDRQIEMIKLLKKHGFKAGQRKMSDRSLGDKLIWRLHTLKLPKIRISQVNL